MTIAEVKDLIQGVASILWPLLAAVVLIRYRNELGAALALVLERVKQGAEVSVGFVTIGQAVGQLRVPEEGAVLTDDHLALIHRSWRVPERDAEFGMPMFQIHVIVFGPSQALNRIDYVIYRLEDSYPNPSQPGGPLHTNFELKELANGYSLLRAEVYVKAQKEPVRLSRFLDLTDKSPKLQGTYQNMSSRR